MTDSVQLALCALGGALIGAAFFGGLWWSLRRGLASKQPVVWQLGSMLLRMGIAMCGFYVVGGGAWQRFVACGVGFFLVRTVIMRWVAHHPSLPASRNGEGLHASRS